VKQSKSSNEPDCRLRRNQDSRIASRQKPAAVEALRAHYETTRECRADRRSLAAKTGHVAANWWHPEAVRGFAALGLRRKIVSIKALAGMACAFPAPAWI
jgi:hypothetical protein